MIEKNQKITDPISIIIFGASGDLCKNKLIPALYNLYKAQYLPNEFKIIGFARTKFTDEQYHRHLKAHYKYDKDAASFFKRLIYCTGDYSSRDSFKELKKILDNGPKNRLFDLAVPSEKVKDICRLLKEEIPCSAYGMGVDRMACPEGERNNRIIFEKPFGHDYKSAKELNDFLQNLFTEKQIYRIDHYLGKESVQNLLAFRFANNIFEPLWNNHFVEYIEVNISEELKVANRGSYFDKAGIVRDIVQNHALQLLSLVTMEAPASFDSNAVRNEKIKLLSSLKIMKEEEVREHTIRGQYKGYHQEKGVNGGSETETFVAMKFFIDNWRWAGVPIYLRAGKAMAFKSTEVVIYFKEVPHKLFPSQTGLRRNVLSFRIQPCEGIHLLFQTKKPGSTFELSQVDMDFSYRESFTQRPVDAYERLLLDALLNDSSLFIRDDEVEASWKFIDPILSTWEKDETIPLYKYKPGQVGPEPMYQFIERDGRQWNDSWDSKTCRIKLIS